MRKVVVGLFLFLSCLFNVAAQAQGRVFPPMPNPNMPKDSLPYRLHPTLPAFNIKLLDSTTVFNTYNIPTGRPIGIILFSPDCEHCIDMTKRLLNGMDSLKDIRFYMVSTMPYMTEMRKFYEKHHLAKYKNIEVVGGDYDFFYITYYGAMRVPDIVLYDADKKLIKLLEASFTVKDIYELTHSKK